MLRVVDILSPNVHGGIVPANGLCRARDISSSCFQRPAAIESKSNTMVKVGVVTGWNEVIESVGGGYQTTINLVLRFLIQIMCETRGCTVERCETRAWWSMTR